MKRIVLLTVLFVFCAVSGAFADSLRVNSSKNSNRLPQIRKDLTAADSEKGITKIERTDKDGGNPPSQATAEQFKQLLGDFAVSETIDDLPFGNYVKQQIDLNADKSPRAQSSLAKIFGSPVAKSDRYYALYFRNTPLALVKEDSEARFDVKKLSDEVPGVKLDTLVADPQRLADQGIGSSDVIISDYLFLEARNKKSVPERMTIEYKELRDFILKMAKQVGSEKAKDMGLALTGGKGLSLSVMDGVVDVPPGFNVTTTAYFKFVVDNKEVWEKINTDLRKLDTMDDQKRDVVSREIRETIENSPIPEDIKKEVLVMYRQLNIIRLFANKKTPTPVAVRSSGTKEDIHITTFLPVSTGSQAGQSDTFLNVKGEADVLDKLRADWASLFTDRAVSYRDDATFLLWSGEIGYEGKTSQTVYYDVISTLREYASKLNKPEFAMYADTMAKVTSPNPGSVNLMNALEAIVKENKDPELQNALNVLKEKADEVVHPEQIGIDVVIMQMVKSYLSGVLFTVNPATKMAGVSQAIYNAWYKNDRSMVYEDKQKNIVGTKPLVVSFEVAFGYGENVVGGKVDPDKFVMGTYDNKNWFTLEKTKGTKLIQMIDVEESIDLLKGKMDEAAIRSLAAQVGNAISYDEVGMRINGILATHLFGTRYLKALEGKEESDKDKKERVQKIANDIADLIKKNESKSAVKDFIKDNFVMASAQNVKGIKEESLDRLIGEVFKSVDRARQESKTGMKKLAQTLGSSAKAEAFISMNKEVWENKEFDLAQRAAVLKTLGISTIEQRNLSYLIRALIDKSFTTNIETTPTHQSVFSITDEEARHIARMAWNITTFYKDHRDIEFAIEIDPTATSDKRVELFAVDTAGKVMSMDEKGNLVESQEKIGSTGKVSMRLYNVQARPYTAEYLKVDVVRARTEADEKYLEDVAPVAIASGTKGENATHAYVLVFDPNKTIDWHAETIRRLKRGEFTEAERVQIKKLGFNPDDYGAEKEQQLPIALYLLEADPNHDPIMRLVDAVITIRGGDTCHAAIFCREQGIPAVTAVGKVMLNGKLLKTGNGLTVDANNGNLYELAKDPAKRIPLNYVKFRIKPYGIPGDDDGMKYPSIGQIIAATSAAQQNSPIMLAPDAAGNALTRAEFKGEELGINVFAGYGYDLIQSINAGTMKKPARSAIQDAISSTDDATRAFVVRINRQVYEGVVNSPSMRRLFVQTVGRDYQETDGMNVLSALQVKAGQRNAGQKAMAAFYEALASQDRGLFDYALGAFERRFNFEYNIITQLQTHPWILEEIKEKLLEKGYASFKEYAGQEFYNFYNLMGFTIAPDQKAKNRAYDFAQDKIRGMPGSEVFSWPGANPLVGLRGSALEIEGVDESFDGNQKVLSFLLESVNNANKNTHNQAWFYVFVRFVRELDSLDTVLERVAQKQGKLPKQIGIMVEVPSDALLVDKLAKKLVQMKNKYKQYGVELTFFSFGTNDYSHLAGKGDREDPRMKLKISDKQADAIIADLKKTGYFYDENANVLPLIDEGADPVIQLMEAVVKTANREGIETSLCGEAITALVNRGDYETAGKIMSMLDSFGISMMSVRLIASMTRYDTMAATKEITVPESGRTVLADLKNAEVKQNAGVIKGEIMYVEKADDLLPESLKGLKGEELKEKREFLKLQSLESARSTMRTFGKIVVMTRNLVALSGEEFAGAVGTDKLNRLIGEGLLKAIGNGLYVWTNLDLTPKQFAQVLEEKRYSVQDREKLTALWKKSWDNTIEGLERQGIDWDDLQYAKAIILDKSVNTEGWDVFRSDKGIVSNRVKAVVEGTGGLRGKLEGQEVTLDYAAAKIYAGNLAVRKKQAQIRSLPIPKEMPEVPTRTAVRDDANPVYQELVYHPLVLLAYQNNTLEKLAPMFDEYLGKLLEEMDTIATESNPEKRQWMLEGFKAKVAGLPDAFIRDVVTGFLPKVEAGESFALSNVKSIRKKYFRQLKKDISVLLNGKTVEEFVTGRFARSMQDALARNPGKFVVHTTTSLNCAQFNALQAAFLVEQLNPNPDYGLKGAARAIGDMWQINRMELQAFKKVREALPYDQWKDFGLQIADLQGTQAGAVVIAWRHILEDMGIGTMVADHLELGVNISTPADTLSVDKYFEYFKGHGKGLTFVSFDAVNLGGAWAGVDIYWDEWRRLAKPEELTELGRMAASIVAAKVEAANKIDLAAEKEIVSFEQVDGALALNDGGTRKHDLANPTDLEKQVIHLKPNQGAPSILGATMTVARLSAKHMGIPLYQYLAQVLGNRADRADFGLQDYLDGVYNVNPIMNIMNGGAHGGWVTDIQEWMIAPLFGQSVPFDRRMEMAHAVVSKLTEIIQSKEKLSEVLGRPVEKAFSTSVGDEGGYTPELRGNEEALKLVSAAINEAGLDMAVKKAIDGAMSELFNAQKKLYDLKADGRSLSGKQWTAELQRWVDYGLVYMEDIYSEVDWPGWREGFKVLGDTVLVTGDDLTVTNGELLKKAIEENNESINSILIKVNQNGALVGTPKMMGTIEVIQYALKKGITVAISHRSGETEDTFISHLVVAANLYEKNPHPKTGTMPMVLLKTGGMRRSERIAKYNELLRIQADLDRQIKGLKPALNQPGIADSVITDFYALEIYDSRGNPTLEVVAMTNDGTIARSAIPSGASTGIRESLEIRDGILVKDRPELLTPEVLKRILPAVKDSDEALAVLSQRVGGKGMLFGVDVVNNRLGPKFIAEKLDVTRLDSLERFQEIISSIWMLAELELHDQYPVLTKEKQQESQPLTVAIVGGATGSIGQGLANRLSGNEGVKVLVGSRRPDPAAGVYANDEIVKQADVVIFAVPAQFVESTVIDLAPDLKDNAIVLSVATGFRPVNGVLTYAAPEGYASFADQLQQLIERTAPGKNIKVVSSGIQSIPAEWLQDRDLILDQQIAVAGEKEASSLVSEKLLKNISKISPVYVGGIEKSKTVEALTPRIIACKKELLAPGSRSIPELVNEVEKLGPNVSTQALVAFNRLQLDAQLARRYGDSAALAEDIAAITETKKSVRQREQVAVGLKRYLEIMPQEAKAERALLETSLAAYDTLAADARMNEIMPQSLESFVGNIKQTNGLEPSVLIISGDAVMDNAGTIAALQQVHKSGINTRIVVWASDEAQKEKLGTLGLSRIADIEALSLYEIIAHLGMQGVVSNRIALINTEPELDVAKLKDEGILVLTMDSSNAAHDATVNLMPLVIARALAGMYANENVTQQLKDMAARYVESSLISESDANAMTDLAASVVSVPLAKVTEQIVKAQVAFEETIDKI